MSREATGWTDSIKLEGLLDGLTDFAGSSPNLYWPAIRRDGVALPPLEHLLDSLIRGQLLEGELPDAIRIAIQARPTVETIALVAERPACDLCATVGQKTEAMFDAPKSRQPGAMWANLCEACFVKNSPGTLGLGQGQVLAANADLPWMFRASLGRAVRYWNQHGIELDYPLPGQPPDELFAVIADNLDEEIGDEFGHLAGVIRVAHLLTDETIADPARSGEQFTLAIGFDGNEPVARKFSSEPGTSPDLRIVVEQLQREGGPWALVASPGPDEDGTQLVAMAAGCSAHEPVAGLTTIMAGKTPIIDNGWKFRLASEVF